MSEVIPVHIVGGFGDVTVGRKLRFLLLDPRISSKLGLISILDRYPQVDKIKSNPKEFLDTVVKPNFKTAVQEEVVDALAKRMQEGGIRYYYCGEAGEGVSDFFKEIKQGDIIDISTPNLSHLGYLRRAIEETLAHIIVEKPVVAKEEEVERARRIILGAMINNPGRVFVDAEHYSHYDLIKYYVDNLAQNITDFGRIKKVKLELREQEKFESQRNKNVIDETVSGGGIWLDLGPHVLSFLTAIGATINPKTIRAQRYKYTDPSIEDVRYQETRMETTFDVYSPNFVERGAKVEIEVGKASDATRKRFRIEHERGYVDIDLARKTYSDSRGTTTSIPLQDPFFNSYMDLVEAVQNKKQPRMPIQKSLDTLTNLFAIQRIAKTNPMINYSRWS